MSHGSLRPLRQGKALRVPKLRPIRGYLSPRAADRTTVDRSVS